MTKKVKDLAPHEKDILENEFLREELIQNRLVDAVVSNMHRKFLRDVGGEEGLLDIYKQLEDHGLTPEKANEMSPDEFADFLIEHNIEIKRKKVNKNSKDSK